MCVFPSISALAFLSECLAVLEAESRYTYVLILGCCCSKLRASCKQRWKFTSEGYLLSFPDARWGHSILLFQLVRKKIPLISSEAYSCSPRRRDSKSTFCIFITSRPWGLAVSAVPVLLKGAFFLRQHLRVIGGWVFWHLLVPLPAVETGVVLFVCFKESCSSNTTWKEEVG